MRKPTASARRPAGRSEQKRQGGKKGPGSMAAKSPRRAAGVARVARAVEAKPVPAKAGRLPDRRNVQAARTELDASAAGSRGKYVYCIIEANDPLKFGPIG